MSIDIDLDKIILEHNNVEWSADGEPVWEGGQIKEMLKEAIKQASAPHEWIEIKEGCELPEYGEMVEVYGLPGSLASILSVFMSDRVKIENPDKLPPNIERNGFHGNCITHWRRINPPESINSINK